MTTESYNKYFEENAEPWLTDAYISQGYNYQTPVHRRRILCSFLDSITGLTSALDVGCGGGHIAIELARRGLDVTAIDFTENMLQAAAGNIANQPEDISKRITLVKIDLRNCSGKFDFISAMGLVGYLESDACFFEKCAELTPQGGYVAASFRNRLFNLFSISGRTIREAESGSLPQLVAEAGSYYVQSPAETLRSFLFQLQSTVGSLLERIDSLDGQQELEAPSYTSSVEPRQSTPEQARKAAAEYGFQPVSFFGVHPHFLVPGLNQCLPPGVYNNLSDTLLSFEAHPLALLWSSVFIGIFRKNAD